MAEKKPLCDFGKQIEIALIQKDKTNDWLIEKVKEDTGRYFDRLTFLRLRPGKLETPASRKHLPDFEYSGFGSVRREEKKWQTFKFLNIGTAKFARLIWTAKHGSF